MQPFAYSSASSLKEAIAASYSGATLIAGGTELVNWMKDAIIATSRVVDINGIAALTHVALDDERLRIGAVVRMSELAAHPVVRRDFPALTQALEKSASPQIRNMASMAGNLLQRTRCPYFRAETPLPCNKRAPNSGCSAIDGEDRSLAVFGGSHQCIATHPSDAAIALAALDATVRVEGPRGTREIQITDLYRLPGRTPEIETVLSAGEVIVEIVVPRSGMARHSHYLKVRERASYEFALVSAAVAIDAPDGIILGARIAVGGVAPRPWRLNDAENALMGVALSDLSGLRGALASDFARARPGKQNGFKIELAQRAVIRALQSAGGTA